jgi:hypothetical protein
MKGPEAFRVRQVRPKLSLGNSKAEIWYQGVMSATGIDGQTERPRQDSQPRQSSKQLLRQTTLVSVVSYSFEQKTYL